MVKKFKKIDILIVLISICSIVILAPILLKKTFKIQMLFKTPPIASFEKEKLIVNLKNSTKWPYQQIDAEFINSGVSLSSFKNFGTSKFEDWEKDTLKLSYISEKKFSNDISELNLKLKEKYKWLFASTHKIDQSNELNNSIKILKDKESDYLEALNNIRKNKMISSTQTTDFSFLIGQPISVRKNLLLTDIELIQKQIKGLEKSLFINNSSLRDLDITLIPNSVTISSYGPHIKEFIIYSLIILAGNVLFFIDKKRKIDK